MRSSASCPAGHPYPESLRPGRSDCAVCHREAQRRRSRADPETFRAKASDWQKKNRARATARQRRWRHENVEAQRTYFREYARRHRVLKKQQLEWAYLRTDPCSYCGQGAGEFDHIQPRSRGGVEGWENLTAACRSCNARKHDATLLTFLGRSAA